MSGVARLSKIYKYCPHRSPIGAGTMTDESLTEPIAAPDREAEYRVPRRCLFGSLLLLWIVMGAVEGLANADISGEGFLFAFAVVNSVLLTLWCSTDGKSRGLHLFHAWELFVFFAWPIAVPIHFLRSRGWKGLGSALLFYALLFSSFALGACAGFYLT